MLDTLTFDREPAYCFGPFRLLPESRLLLNNEQPVAIGSRALEILIALVERRGQLVRKDELMARVWPGIIVVEANLAVQVAALRRALGDGREGNRFLLNVPGRGYRFVSSVIASELEGREPSLPDRERDLAHSLRQLKELSRHLSTIPHPAEQSACAETRTCSVEVNAAEGRAAGMNVTGASSLRSLLASILQQSIQAVELSRAIIAGNSASEFEPQFESDRNAACGNNATSPAPAPIHP